MSQVTQNWACVNLGIKKQRHWDISEEYKYQKPMTVLSISIMISLYVIITLLELTKENIYEFFIHVIKSPSS